MDRTAASLLALVPRGWLLVGLLGVLPAFLTSQSTPPALAVSLGGLLLAYAAFKKLTAGLWHLAGAAIAWEQVAPLFHAAARLEVATPPALTPASGNGAASAEESAPVLAAHDLVFRYRVPGEPVLRGVSLRIGVGERILLEGPSGGGKSTLATLLTGLRRPESGLLLLGGLDRQTLGAAGWQLSHGERSRLFLARAVLQGATCLILDESFAALDPATLQQALRCVLERVPTLVVIAHP
jgi:ATP-binding cassette subfamily B protein